MTRPGEADDFVAAIRAGNHQRAAESLVLRFGSEVFGLCLAMVRDRATAEDLSQEVFASAFTGLGGYRGEASPRTWLLKIARNRCIDHLRQKKRWSVRDEEGDPDEIPAELSLPNTLLSQRSLVEHALCELEEVDRALVILRFRQGLDYQELATAFGLKVGTVRMRVSRALRKMRDLLLEEITVPRAPMPSAPVPSAPVPSSPRPAAAPSASPPLPAAAPQARRAPASRSRHRSTGAPPPSAPPSAPPFAPGAMQAGQGDQPHILSIFFRSQDSRVPTELTQRLRGMVAALPAQ